ncbi:MAG: FHA domain-containing protein [Candidatus Atribacteria bacterium]|nr:FHA domain-containing protein [Candidatus Atribacteria bacterium]
MIICPNCQHKEMSGAIYCSKCGAQLIDVTIATHKIHTAEARQEAQRDTGRTQPPLPAHLQSWISLNMIESGQILPLADRTEFTLGRSEEGQPIVPDVDLSPHNAYANGVSRLHAVLKLIQEQFVIVDLGSSNGTYLNGIRLPPYVETPVAHGDVIYLGKLKMQVLIK